MNQMDAIAIVSLVGALILAMRGFRARRPGFGKTLVMGVIWAVIIAALAYALQW